MSITVREPPRVLFVAVILFGHAVAIFVLAVRVEVTRDDQQAEFLALPILLMPIRNPERTVPLEADELGLTPRRAIRPERKVTAAPTEQPIQEGTAIFIPTPDSAPDSGTRPDWMAQAEQIARQAETNSRPRAFGKADKDDAPADADSPNLFENKSPRRAGYVEMIAPGVERRWMSSRCYREFGRLPDLTAGTRIDLNPITCLIGPGPPRTDLFDELKPDYLKRQE